MRLEGPCTVVNCGIFAVLEKSSEISALTGMFRLQWMKIVCITSITTCPEEGNRSQGTSSGGFLKGLKLGWDHSTLVSFYFIFKVFLSSNVCGSRHSNVLSPHQVSTDDSAGPKWIKSNQTEKQDNINYIDQRKRRTPLLPWMRGNWQKDSTVTHGQSGSIKSCLPSKGPSHCFLIESVLARILLK